MTSFTELGLAEPILRALTDAQYTTPTPIQAQTIPHVIAARDVVGIAQTGTGKTAAFALPILHRIGENRPRPERRACRVLVLSPTRELSAQILESFVTYGKYMRPTATLAIGGVPINRQVRALNNGVEVLVATPGRLLDLVRMSAVRLDQVDVFVLDEADRMLDMGFIHDIRTIISKLPSKRQNLFFSATMAKDVSELAAAMLKDPVRVAVTPEATTVERIAQQVIHVDRGSKANLLADMLKKEAAIDRALVFTRTKRGADKVVRTLVGKGIAAEAIHGNKSQGQRERVLAAFRAGSIRTLVATDIAARGIDVDGISHVFNFDLPHVPESYVHRIGRTARAGAEGIAISFCESEDRPLLRAIEKLIRITIPATDQRGVKTESSDEAPAPRQSRPQGERRPEGRSNNGAPRSNSRPGGNGGGRRSEHRPTEHRAGEARPSENKSGGRPPRQNGNGNGNGRRPDQTDRQSAPAVAGDTGLGNVGFMHRKPAPSHRPEGATGERRAPR
ncbi:MAG: helicase [Xanthobacteraceae bacterium]|nr:helicase [Xanthobacteraceae bacterium]